MDSPQYPEFMLEVCRKFGFKPYYKWIVLNTSEGQWDSELDSKCFKPYYKWIVLNTEIK